MPLGCRGMFTAAWPLRGDKDRWNRDMNMTEWENTWIPHHLFMVTLASIQGLSVPVVRALPSCWRGEILSGRHASRFTSDSLLYFSISTSTGPRDHNTHTMKPWSLNPCSCYAIKSRFLMLTLLFTYRSSFRVSEDRNLVLKNVERSAWVYRKDRSEYAQPSNLKWARW